MVHNLFMCRPSWSFVKDYSTICWLRAVLTTICPLFETVCFHFLIYRTVFCYSHQKFVNCIVPNFSFITQHNVSFLVCVTNLLRRILKKQTNVGVIGKIKRIFSFLLDDISLFFTRCTH